MKVRKKIIVLAVLSSLICVSNLEASMSFSLMPLNSHNMPYARDGSVGLGGFLAKFQRDSFNVFNISAPSVKAGCNGIDIGLGGISFISFDELKEKLTAIMQNAVGYAFKLALSTLCKECDNILSALEEISDMINSLNFDSCSIAEKGVNAIVTKATGHAVADGKIQGFNQARDSNNKSSFVNNYVTKFRDSVKGFSEFFNENGKGDTTTKNIILGAGSAIEYAVKKGVKDESKRLATQKLISVLLGQDICGRVSINNNEEFHVDIMPTTHFIEKTINGSTTKQGLKPNELVKEVFNTLFAENFANNNSIKVNASYYKATDDKSYNRVDYTETFSDYKKIIDDARNSIYGVLGSMSGDNDYKLTSDGVSIINNFDSSLPKLLNHIVFEYDGMQPTGAKPLTNCKTSKKAECYYSNVEVAFIIKEFGINVFKTMTLNSLSKLKEYTGEILRNDVISNTQFKEKVGNVFVPLIEQRMGEIINLTNQALEEIKKEKETKLKELKDAQKNQSSRPIPSGNKRS
ncbi:conjugal transfer protein TraH [Campylobacter sp. MG1]|uniref:conjugal transfer protein TraH n=1 Tax=Campylobacter sp. MG1 TaxID=2976332 RepID=UPI00226CEAE7|nr:conjugal transfer protein TraH [Campylobacter sp. MG1]